MRLEQPSALRPFRKVGCFSRRAIVSRTQQLLLHTCIKCKHLHLGWSVLALPVVTNASVPFDSMYHQWRRLAQSQLWQEDASIWLQAVSSIYDASTLYADEPPMALSTLAEYEGTPPPETPPPAESAEPAVPQQAPDASTQQAPTSPPRASSEPVPAGDAAGTLPPDVNGNQPAAPGAPRFGPEPDPDVRLTAAEKRLEGLQLPGRQRQDALAEQLRQQELNRLRNRAKADAAGRRSVSPISLARLGSPIF